MNKSFRDAMMEMMMQGQGARPSSQPLVDQGQFIPGPLPTFPDDKSSEGGMSEMLDPATAMKLMEMFGSFSGSGGGM